MMVQTILPQLRNLGLTALRVILGALFLVSSLSKLRDITGFARTVRSFNVLPESLVSPFAMILPPVEYIVGVCLILGFYTRLAAAVSTCLLLMFTLAVGWSLWTKNIVSCGCFDLLFKSEVSGSVFLRNLLLVIVSILVFAGKNSFLTLSGYLQRLRESSTLQHSWPRYGSQAFSVILAGLFAVLFFVGGMPTLPPASHGDDTVLFLRQLHPRFSQPDTLRLLQYGEQLPRFQMQTVRREFFSADELRGAASVLHIVTPRSRASLNQSIRYTNDLTRANNQKPVRVVLIVRLAGEVEKSVHEEIVQTLRRQAEAMIVLDEDDRLSAMLRVPAVFCPVTLVSDETQTVRLALQSAPEHIVHEIIARYSRSL